MSERDRTKSGIYIADPGSVGQVNDTGGIWCGNDDRPFVPHSLMLKRRAEKARRKRIKRAKN